MIVHIDTNLDSSRCLIQERVYKDNRPMENFSRIRFCKNLYLLSIPDPGKIIFVNVQIEPDAAQVYDGKKFVTCFEIHPFNSIFVNNGAATRRKDS